MAYNCKQYTIWESGFDGYHTHRIPAIVVTNSGSILAFCEGRRNSKHDTGDIDMLVKRSQDNGLTWSDQSVIWSDLGNTCGNPCPVVDRETGIVWLLMTHNLGIDHESQIINGTSEGTRTVWVTASTDDGLTWHSPLEITKSTKRIDWTWYATGPGNGIQLSSGRLLIPCDHIEGSTKRYFSHVIYSDDHGQTWHMGGKTPKDQVNECCIAELKNGDIILNTRNYARDFRTRQICISTDGGMTWGNQHYNDELIEPICQAALIRSSSQTNQLLFSNPASRVSRCNLTIRLSDENGLLWPHFRVLHPGPAAYSSLTILPDGTIGCLYECGESDPYETIMFALFDLDWISDKKNTAGFGKNLSK